MTSSSGPPAKKRRLDFSDDITVIVGTGAAQQKRTFHKDALCKHSKFFRAALNRDFKEGKEKTVPLPDIDVESFESYMHWTYTGEIVVQEPDEEEKDIKGRNRKILLTKLYVVADVLDDTLLRNEITDSFIECLKRTDEGPPLGAFRILYKSTPESCMLRKVALEWQLRRGVGPWLEEKRKRLPKTFLSDLAIGWSKARDRNMLRDPLTTSKCTYHEHNEEVPECSVPAKERLRRLIVTGARQDPAA